MTLQEIEREVWNTLIEEGYATGPCSPQANLQTDLGIDSLDTIDVTMSLEEVFELDLEVTELEACRTVRDVAEWLDGVLNRKAGES